MFSSVKPIHKALAPAKNICSKRKISLEINQETGQPSNVKHEVKQKRKIKKRQSNSGKDEVKEKRKRKKRQFSSAKDEAKEKKKRKRKQSSNIDGDSWMPAGWKKIVKYRKTGKLAGCTYKVSKTIL